MEEPVCDPPAVSLHFVSKLARQHVKVVLSGEGGDEAFGGYNDYRNFQLLERLKSAIHPMEGVLSATLGVMNRIGPFRKLGKFAPFVTTSLTDHYFSRVASPFNYFNRCKADLYSTDFTSAIQPERSVEMRDRLVERVRGQSPLDQMQYIDIKTTLPICNQGERSSRWAIPWNCGFPF